MLKIAAYVVARFSYPAICQQLAVGALLKDWEIKGKNESCSSSGSIGTWCTMGKRNAESCAGAANIALRHGTWVAH
jgi:hypothetical protein